MLGSKQLPELCLVAARLQLLEDLSEPLVAHARQRLRRQLVRFVAVPVFPELAARLLTAIQGYDRSRAASALRSAGGPSVALGEMYLTPCYGWQEAAQLGARSARRAKASRTADKAARRFNFEGDGHGIVGQTNVEVVQAIEGSNGIGCDSFSPRGGEACRIIR
jgi:hypothetical protein